MPVSDELTDGSPMSHPEKVTPFGTLERRIRLKSPPSGPALAIR